MQDIYVILDFLTANLKNWKETGKSNSAAN